MSDSDELLTKINAAVAGMVTTEARAKEAQADLVSRSKEVGLLLLEAKKLHPKVREFEVFLKKVHGLGRSRAYDLLRLAGGRTTDEQLRQETRDRVRKHREKNAPLLQANLGGLGDALGRFRYIGLRNGNRLRSRFRLRQLLLTDPRRSAVRSYYPDKFINACRNYLCRVEDESDRDAVIHAWTSATRRWKPSKKAKAA